tara:strand:+ start:180888 stop:182474 length:1587 start_codon:yes stop_codon:yes gene_type:complete
MADRLQIKAVVNSVEIFTQFQVAMKELTNRDLHKKVGNLGPLASCCEMLAKAEVRTIIVQTGVHDPDFLAEFSAYYSRQFAPVPRSCTRLHFFKQVADEGQQVLDFLDSVDKNNYLGFITLRPVIKSPIGASILSVSIVDGYMRCVDSFPVHIAGVEFHVVGTPFMQQDNAVGACAQASIWMALRTLRRREGDRAYDPAQITDAATKYFVTGRVRPNRGGLTLQQMIEAVRAAGYSSHAIPLGTWFNNNEPQMNQSEILDSLKMIHAYIESEIPVLLLLFPPSGGHAVVAIGHTWDSNKPLQVQVPVELDDGQRLNFPHAASWVPSLVIHNDNSGPYRDFPAAAVPGYCFQHAAYAIPLLPVDVFMTGEEAMVIASVFLADLFLSLKQGGIRDAAELDVLVASLTLRLLLVEKRKLRKWAATETMVPELKDKLRLMELPKRVWLLEIHQSHEYGNQADGNIPNSLIGIMLIDPTADVHIMSMLLIHWNLPALLGLDHGVLLTWDTSVGVPDEGIQTNDVAPMSPIRMK